MERSSAETGIGGPHKCDRHPAANARRIQGPSWQPPVTMYARGLHVTTLIHFADPELRETTRAIAGGLE
jgi:hypothetical protein